MFYVAIDVSGLKVPPRDEQQTWFRKYSHMQLIWI